MEEILHQFVYPIIYRVFYIPGGADFVHQQYVYTYMLLTSKCHLTYHGFHQSHCRGVSRSRSSRMRHKPVGVGGVGGDENRSSQKEAHRIHAWYLPTFS